MAITYFGSCDPSTGAGNGSAHCGYAWSSQWTTAGYTCPGTGAQTVKTLGVESDGTAGYTRMAIYDTSRNLICYATSRKADIAGWLSWDDTEITWVSGTTLTGGTTYLLVITTSANSGALGTGGLAADTCRYLSNDYSNSAWPDPIAAGTAYTTEWNVRCGVEAAAGGTTESLSGSVTASASTTNDFLSRYRYQMAPTVSGAATTPNTFLSRIRYQMMQAVAGAATTVANLEELAGSIIETMSVAVTAVASTVGMIFRYRFDSTNVSAAANTTGMIFRYRFPQVVVTAVATTWANLVELGAAAARHFRVYMRIGRGRF